jgi:mannose-6-phosphate isomerase-like protein (cupin superfamily)
MHGFVTDIEFVTNANKDYRRALYTGPNLQLVLMALQPGEDIGEEVHQTHDQFFRVETGRGAFVIDGLTTPIKEGWGMVVPAGARHNVINSGAEPMHLYTIYAPPQHRDDVVRSTKAEAEAKPEHFDGKTSE